MPLFVIPYPHFDPVLLQLGPFAIRWYALAYIAGILLGWVYARAIIRNERYWGGTAPLTVVEFDDFVLWVTLGIILGGRIGYVLFYNLPYFASHPLQIFQLWHGGMSFHGGFTGCVVAVILFAKKRGLSILSLGDITCAVGPIGLFLGRLANFINDELWGRPTDVPWAMVFPSGGPVAAPSEPALRGDPGGPGAAGGALCPDPRRRLEAAGADHRRLRLRLRGRAHVLRVFPRARRPARLPVGRRHHGAIAVDPIVPRRSLLHHLRAEAQAAAELSP